MTPLAGRKTVEKLHRNAGVTCHKLFLDRLKHPTITVEKKMLSKSHVLTLGSAQDKLDDAASRVRPNCTIAAAPLNNVTCR